MFDAVDSERAARMDRLAVFLRRRGNAAAAVALEKSKADIEPRQRYPIEPRLRGRSHKRVRQLLKQPDRVKPPSERACSVCGSQEHYRQRCEKRHPGRVRPAEPAIPLIRSGQ